MTENLQTLPTWKLQDRLDAAGDADRDELMAEWNRRGGNARAARLRSAQNSAADRGDAAARRGRLNGR